MYIAGTGTISDNTYDCFVHSNTFQPQTLESILKMKQVKVAVFKITRSQECEEKVVSTQFLKEMWVEVKPGTDVKLTVASKLTKEDLQGADLSELDIREITTETFY